MITVQCDELEHSFKIRFRYDRAAVERIKSIPGRQFRKDLGSCWLIPKTSQRALERFLAWAEGKAASREIQRPYVNPVTVYPTRSKGEKLWKHQLAAFRYLWNRQATLIDLKPGSGKSRIFVDFCLNAPEIRRVLILCPKSFVGGWSAQFEKYGGSPVVCACLDAEAGTVPQRVQAGLRTLREAHERNLLAVIVINYDVCWRDDAGMADFLLDAQFDVVGFDECFVGDARIATPHGDVPLRNIKYGDVVYGYDAQRHCVVETEVLDSFMHTTQEYLYPFFGTYGTGSHPVWTQEEGYVWLEKLYSMDYTVYAIVKRGGVYGENISVRAMRTDFCKSLGAPFLFEGVPLYISQAHTSHMPWVWNDVCAQVYDAQILQEDMQGVSRVLCRIDAGSGDRGYAIASWLTQTCDVTRQSIQRPTGSGDTTQGTGCTSHARVCGAIWRQRQSADCTRKDALGGIRVSMDMEFYCTIRQEDCGLSNTLQSRYSPSVLEDCSRSRWCIPRDEGWQRTGYTQGVETQRIRMVGGACDQQGCVKQTSGGIQAHQVYNITTGTGNYFAQGILVHNCQRLRGHNTKVSRFAHRLGVAIPIRIGLSGTPFPETPMDPFGVCRALDASLFGTSFMRYRSRYAQMGGYGNYQVQSYINQHELRAKIDTLRFTMEPEGYELPSEQDIVIPLVLPAKVQKLYKTLENDLYAKIGAGEIYLANAATAFGRLQQVCSGVIPVDDVDTSARKMTVLHTLKQEALADLLDSLPAEQSIVVICRFHYDLAQVHKIATEVGRVSAEVSGRPGRPQAHIDGGVWVGPETVLAVQAQSGVEGLDLTRAHVVCYYSYGLELGKYIQSRARIRRAGQTQPCTYYHLVVKGGIDQKIRRLLEKKQHVLRGLLEEGGTTE